MVLSPGRYGCLPARPCTRSAHAHSFQVVAAMSRGGLPVSSQGQFLTSPLMPAAPTVGESTAMIAAVGEVPTVVFAMRRGAGVASMTTIVVSWLSVMVVVSVVRPLGGVR